MVITRRLRLLVLALSLGALLASSSSGIAQTPTKLIADVGLNDTFTITLTNEAGARVSDIPAGTYTIEVRDHSDMHNFHLTGPGVDESTTVGEVGTKVWTVTFQDKERYRYVCDPHSTSMSGSFTIGGGPPPSPPPPPPRRPKAKNLTATVGPGATISLKNNGRRVSRLKAGRYRIAVRDRSAMHNFHLRGPGVNKKTAVAFKGTRTWTLTLRKGRYRYLCDPHAAKMRGSFRVT